MSVSRCKPPFECIGAVVLSLLGFFAATPAWSQLPASAWPDYGGGNANTHRAAAVGPGGNIHAVWVYQIPQPVGGWNYAHSQPTIASDAALCFATYGYGF